MEGNKFFIEIDVAQISESGQAASGDVYLQRKYPGRIITVLSNGAGNGIKANITASVISSMIVNYTYSENSYLNSAKAAIETFSHGYQNHDVSQATFTIVDIKDSGEVKVVEFNTPSTIFIRNNLFFHPPRIKHEMYLNGGAKFTVNVIQFNAQVEDRVLFYSEGVIQSGISTLRLPNGWGEVGLHEMIKDTITAQSDISATSLCRKIVFKAETNDLFTAKDDISCASIYFREPRSLLICTGAPFDDKKDKYLADIVDNYNGDIIISGGTTSQIIARELGREINIIMKRDPSGLPPVGMMEGVTLVTEGVLTLGKVRLMLETINTTYVTGRGTDARIVKMLLEHDIIEFYVGTRINALHQAPDLPIELELRRNVIKDIARLLEKKFLKQIIIKYI